MVIDKQRHVKTRQTLVKMIEHSEYDLGYGDKEMFWLAMTISQEDFAFEPFLAGQYGDCSGFVLHYHPDDNDIAEELEKHERIRERKLVEEFDSSKRVIGTENGQTSTTTPHHSKKKTKREVRPLYINAEYIVEYHEKLRMVGEFLARSITKPVLIKPDMKKPPHNNCYRRDYRHNNCTCGDYECITPPVEMNMYVLRSQWLMMSTRHQNHNIQEGHCTYLVNDFLPLLQRIFTDFPKTFDSNECYVLGCPLIPMMIVKNESEWLPGRGRICDPIRYTNVTDNDNRSTNSIGSSSNIAGNDTKTVEDFATIAERYRRPLPQYNIPKLHDTYPAMQCGVKPQLYLYSDKDHLFHAFPNWATFVKMGFDTDYVTKYREDDCQNAVFGDPLPEV